MGRIIDYPEISNFTDEDYLVVDGSEGGTRKILGQAVKGVVDSTPTEDSQNAVSSGGVWNSLNDISEEFQSLRSDAYDVYPKKKLTADVVQFDDGAENVPVSEMTAYIYPSMSGSGMPSRTNVRTISGSNSVNVYHANKNLIAPLTYQDAPETVYLGVENSENLLIFFKAGDYRISVKMRDNSAIVPYWVISGGTPHQSETMHLDADSEVSIYLYDANGVSTIDIESFQVEVGINVTDIETHDGEVTNVAFPSGQGDIYLGRVNPVEGKLLIDAIIYERNSSTMNNDENKPGWSYTGLQTYNVDVGTFDTVVYWPDGTVRFTPVNVGSAYSIEYENDDYNVILPVDSYNMTQSQWISLGINIQILITLSTPIEVDIDPIEFRTFYKNNTYFTNSGKLDVEYRLDLAAYVDNQTDMSDKIEKTYPTDTASGAIAHFTDGADDIPMKSVKVAIEPVQDLHGQEAPYPAGGGANKFDGIVVADGSYLLSANYIPVTEGQTWYIYAPNFPANDYCYAKLYDSNFSEIDTGTQHRIGRNTTYTIPNGVAYIKLRYWATFDATNIAFNYPATVTTYSPYSNICPISGWTGANVVRTGVNIWDEEWELGSLSPSNGSPTVDLLKIRSKNFTAIKPNTRYYCVCDNPASYIWYYDENKEFLSFVINNVNKVVTTPDHAYYAKFRIGDASNPQTDYSKRLSFNYPFTDHDYHLYTGNTYSIIFPSEAGTIYGGELDITNGTLTVDRAMVDLGTLLWVYKTTDTIAPVPYFGVDSFTSRREGSTNLVCSQYASASGGRNTLVDKSCSTYNTSNSKSICIADSSYTDAATFKTAMDGVQLVYELATPITYNLTPTEIKSLLGDNNVWADAGNIEVAYRADPNLYIDKRIGTEAPMIATDNIVSGSYFMIGSNLYKATANIASGAAVVVGTNATAKTMAEALNEINA